MKRIFLLATVVLLAVVGCSKNEVGLQDGRKTSNEMKVSPISTNGNTATRGYVESTVFEETYRADLHSTGKTEATPRTMQLSAYLYPQSGEAGNYFVGTTFEKGDSDELWHADPAVYWPVGGTMDFLAYSLTTEAQYNKGVKVAWNKDNAAHQVVLTVPAENSQNDILFASASNVKANSEASPIRMQFNHAQAWLEFVLTGTADVVIFKRIELEQVYNAGVLTLSNNGGSALAKWNFEGENPQNIAVDNFDDVCDLTSAPQFLDILIPQQSQTAFVLYYTLGESSQELSYRFDLSQKTWLMGEKYIYKINVNANEVTVDPSVIGWNEHVAILPGNYEIPEDGIESYFSVNADGKKVAFSKGNLIATYDETNDKYDWDFAPSQLFSVGRQRNNISIDNPVDEKSVDLFGWSTASTYYGISTSSNNADYYGNFKDWGENIGNGKTWRTLTKGEWNYIINERPGNRYCKAVISGKYCLVLFPDNWVKPEGINITSVNSPYVGYVNSFNEGQFKQLEESGVVVLPSCGRRINGSTVDQVNKNGFYWSATSSGYDQAMRIHFDTDDCEVYDPSNRSYGRAVRLVSDLN